MIGRRTMTEQLPSSLFSVLKQLDREGITGYEKYKRVRRYIQFKAREEHAPVCGTFELTPLCNLSCKMCYVRLDREQMGSRDVLPVETWIRIIDQAVGAGLMYATMTGGECLTYDGWKELYLHFRSRGVEVVLLSNGILMTEEMAQFLADYPPSGIQITLYGADEEEYERVTGHRAFRKVLDNIDRLKRYGLPVMLSMTPNYYMKKGKELVQLLYDLGLPFQINSGLNTPREETGRKLLEASLDTYVEVSDEDLPDPGSADGDESRKRESGVRCAAGRSSYCVTWDGKMKPCNTFPGIEADILTMGFQAAWEQISRQVQEVLLPVECTNCAYERICNRCIIEHLDHGSPGHVNPDVCEHVRRFVKEGFLHL